MTPATKDPRLIAYNRVSDARGKTEDKAQSVKQQRAAAKAIVALTPGAKIVDTVDAVNASGGKDWPEPKLAEIIARVDRGEADGVVVFGLDRWGRSLRALEVIERWAQEGKTFLSASDKFDASTPSGRMALRMMMVVARYYWEATQDRFALSQRDAVAAGKWIGPAPLGYLAGDDGRLVVDPETSGFMREAFRLAAVDGLHAATEYLERVLPDRRWRTSDARRILSSRVYVGEIHYGELDPNVDAHEPLTTPAIWTAAQTEPQGRRSNGHYPLTHIARCECGAGLVGALQSVHGRRYRRMRCSNPACRGGSSISADKLETYVAELMAHALHNTRFRELLSPDGLDAARDALELAETERDWYRDDVETRALLGSDAEWRKGLAVRVRAVETARERYQVLASQASRVERLPSAGELNDPEQFARALRVAVDSIVVVPGRGDVKARVGVRWVGGLDLEHVAGPFAA